MNAAIIAIGDELIQGFTVDSNSSWISNFVLDYGINVYKTVSIGDRILPCLPISLEPIRT